MTYKRDTERRTEAIRDKVTVTECNWKPFKCQTQKTVFKSCLRLLMFSPSWKPISKTPCLRLCRASKRPAAHALSLPHAWSHQADGAGPVCSSDYPLPRDWTDGEGMDPREFQWQLKVAWEAEQWPTLYTVVCKQRATKPQAVQVSGRNFLSNCTSKGFLVWHVVCNHGRIQVAAKSRPVWRKVNRGGGGTCWKLNKHKEAGGGDNKRKNEKEKRESGVGAASSTYLRFSPVSQISDRCIFCCPVLHAVIKSRRLIYKTATPVFTLSSEKLGSEMVNTPWPS